MIREILNKLGSEDDDMSKLEAGDYNILKDKTCEEIKVLLSNMNNRGADGIRIAERIWNLQSVSVKTNFI